MDHRPASTTAVFGGSDHPRHGPVRSSLANSPTFLRLVAGAAVLDSARLTRTFFGLGPFRAISTRIEDADSGRTTVTLEETATAAYYQPLAKVAADGSEIFGVQVVATPGHTLGHISVFDPETGVLVTGDAVRNTSGLQGSDPQYTDDQDAAAASLTKLAKLPVKTILFGHGEPLTSGAAAALGTLAS